MDSKNPPTQAGAVDLNSLPFVSRYRLLQWYGSADGATPLTSNFQAADVIDRTVVIKSLRVIPYTPEGSAIKDITMDDGAGTVFYEELPGLTRIERVNDTYNESMILNMVINGTPVPFLSYNPSLVGYPLDLYVDNVYYKYPAKVQSWTVVCGAFITSFPPVGASVAPLVKVLVECYLI